MGNPGLHSARTAPARRPRWGTLALVVALHIAALFALARIFAPQFTADAIDRATSLVTVNVTTPEEPPPPPEPELEPEPGSGKAGAEAPKATPREVTAPRAPLPRSSPAPIASSTGSANTSGAAEQGVATGAGGVGDGLGSGGTGTGGGNLARPLQLLSGTIDNARDYPTPPGGREVRRGHDVIIELTVGPNGRVAGCRVTDPSPDAQADAITCRLATDRFVFRPRLDANGQAVTGIFRWRQRWF